MGSEHRTYLDYNASAPLLAAAREAMTGVLGLQGNASSVHFEGRTLRKYIENARCDVADLVGVKHGQIVFTSGASEAANFALSPVLRAGGKEIHVGKLLVAASEHPCVLNGGRFTPSQVEIVKVLESGVIDLDHLEACLAAQNRDGGVVMVAVMAANNETGVIQPIEKVVEITQSHGALLFVDAVQALGKMPLDLATMGADFVALSSHKIGGPQGAGALVLGDASLTPAPLITGGGQEHFLRGGTENAAAIVGFGAACRWHLDRQAKEFSIAGIRDCLEQELKQISLAAGNGVAQPRIFGENAERLPNTSAFAVKGVPAEMALISLDLEGISVSSGSACSSGKVRKSHVLEAMAIDDELAQCALRISLGWDADAYQADQFLSAWKKIIENRL